MSQGFEGTHIDRSHHGNGPDGRETSLPDWAKAVLNRSSAEAMAKSLIREKSSQAASMLGKLKEAPYAAEVVSALPPGKRAEVVRKMKGEVAEALKQELWRQLHPEVKADIADQHRSSPRQMAKLMKAEESPSRIAETLGNMLDSKKADKIRHGLDRQTRARVRAAEVASGSLGPTLPERSGMIARTVTELVKMGQDLDAYSVLNKELEQGQRNAGRIIGKVEPWIVAAALQQKELGEARALVKGLSESHYPGRQLRVDRILEQVPLTMADEIVPHIPGRGFARQAERLAQTRETARSLVSLVRDQHGVEVELPGSTIWLSHPNQEEVRRITSELKLNERVNVLRRIAEMEGPSIFQEVIFTAHPRDVREATRLLMQSNPREAEKLSQLLPSSEDPALDDRARYFSEPVASTKQIIEIMQTLLESDRGNETNKSGFLLPLSIIKGAIVDSSPAEAKMYLQELSRSQLAALWVEYKHQRAYEIALKTTTTGTRYLFSAALTSVLATGPVVAKDHGFHNMGGLVLYSIVGDIAGVSVAYKLRNLSFPGMASTLGTTTWSGVTMALQYIDMALRKALRRH